MALSNSSMTRAARSAEDVQTGSPIQWSAPEFGAVYNEHSKAIYYLALRLLGDPAAAEDAAHDVFLKAYQNRSQFRGEASVRTWLYRIAINHCHNLRQAWHQRNVHPTDDRTILDGVSVAKDPLRVLETKELGDQIQKTLDSLPGDYRLLLLLSADERMSYDEIADLTGQTADAVRGKLHRARKAFQENFRNLYERQ